MAIYSELNRDTFEGDVVGPASSTDGDIAIFDGTTGKLLQDGGVGLPQNDGELIIGDTAGDAQIATITPPAAGIGITNGAGSITFGLTNDLAAVEGLGTTGLARRSGVDTWDTQTFVPTTGWTPQLEFGGATTGITYNQRSASYTRLSNMVFISLFIELSSKGTATGNASISGFPINAISIDALAIRYSSLTFTADQIVCRVQADKIFIDRVSSAGATVLLNDTNFADNSSFQISGVYRV